MLYWRELGPQSGQYSINIGVKISNSLFFFYYFLFDYFRQVRYMRFDQAVGFLPVLRSSFIFPLDVPRISIPVRADGLSEFHSLIVQSLFPAQYRM